MRRAAVVLALALLGGSAGPAGGATPGACARQDVVISQETLSVDVELPAGAVRPGKAASFEVAVSRPGRADPTGAGPDVDPPARVPAPEVLAAVWVGLEPYAVATVEQTDAEGTALVSVPIPRKARPGTYDVRGFAWEVVVSGCVTLEEVGRIALSDALTVAKRRPK